MANPMQLPEIPIAPPTADRPLFAGFLRRLGAFVIDCILLYVAARGLAWAARPALLALNPALPWLAHVAAFAYFALAQGPVGHGRTLGNSILDIRVVGEDGRELGWRDALKRSLVQQCAFLPLIDPLIYGLVFPAAIRQEMWLAIQIVQVLALTLLVTLAFGIGIHPRKRAWHDLFGRTFVINEPSSFKFDQEMAAGLDLVSQRKIAMYPKITLVFWFIGTVLLLLKPIKMASMPELREQAREAATLEHNHPIRPYEVTMIQFPDAELRNNFLSYVAAHRQGALDRGENVPTTETLRQRLINDGSSVLVRCDRATGAFTKADLENPALREGIDAMRRDLWTAWQVKRDAAGTSTTLPAAERFHALLFEPFQLLFHNESKLSGLISGPADPDAGALAFEEYVQPPPLQPGAKQTGPAGGGATQEPTTATQPAAVSPTSPTAARNAHEKPSTP